MSTEHLGSLEVSDTQIKFWIDRLANFILHAHTAGLQVASWVTDSGLGKGNEGLNSGNRSISAKERDPSRIIKGTVVSLIWQKSKKTTWRGKGDGYHVLSYQIHFLLLPTKLSALGGWPVWSTMGSLALWTPAAFSCGSLGRPSQGSGRSKDWFPYLDPCEVTSRWLNSSI